PDRPGRAVAPGVRRAAQRLRQRPDYPGAAGLVLRRGPAPRAPALPGWRSDGDALLWLGPVAPRRTVAVWLWQLTQETLAPLVALNRDLVTEALARTVGNPRENSRGRTFIRRPSSAR